MRALFLTSGRRCEHAWLWAARPVHFFHHALPPAINGPNTIGNAVVRTIGIEPTSGHQLVQSAEGRQPAADPDSRARTHLANERTFLAWLRTGLSLMAVGLAAARFLPVDLIPGFPYVRSFAAMLVLSGTVMVLYRGESIHAGVPTNRDRVVRSSRHGDRDDRGDHRSSWHPGHPTGAPAAMISPLPAPDDDSGDSVVPGMAAEHAILGLLALSESGTGHGYDLARQFSPEAPLGDVVRLEPGMVYHHLKKLERLGWVSAVPEARTGAAGAASLRIIFFGAC